MTVHEGTRVNVVAAAVMRDDDDSAPPILAKHGYDVARALAIDRG